MIRIFLFLVISASAQESFVKFAEYVHGDDTTKIKVEISEQIKARSDIKEIKNQFTIYKKLIDKIFDKMVLEFDYTPDSLREARAKVLLDRVDKIYRLETILKEVENRFTYSEFECKDYSDILEYYTIEIKQEN